MTSKLKIIFRNRKISQTYVPDFILGNFEQINSKDLKDKGISVVAIYPNKTNTPIHDQYIDKDDPSRKEMLTTEKVAQVILEAVLVKDKDVKELNISQ